MFVTILLGIILIISIVGLLVGLGKHGTDTGTNGLIVSGVAFVVFVIVTLFVTITPIGPSDVGIVTFGGHTVGSDLSPGYHFVAPWETETTWDDSVQFETYEGKGCLTIRIANSQSACLNVKVQWRDNPAGSDYQFKKYRGNFENVSNAYMSRIVVEGFFNNVFEKFDPVQTAAETKSGTSSGTTVTSLTAQVKAAMAQAYKGQITISQLSGGNIAYDSQVQAALNELTTAAAKTNVAIQNEKTALAQKAAADTLAQAHLTPAVLFQECLNDTLQLTNPSPAWNCGSEQSLSLLLNGGKKA